jgi:glycerol-3-phosphate dehydrogenase
LTLDGAETTIGYRTEEDGKLWQKLFTTDNFRVQIIDDVAGVSLCGALKSESRPPSLVIAFRELIQGS